MLAVYRSTVYCDVESEFDKISKVNAVGLYQLSLQASLKRMFNPTNSVQEVKFCLGLFILTLTFKFKYQSQYSNFNISYVSNFNFKHKHKPSDDNSSLFNKKSVLQTKYRPLFIKKTDQIQTRVSENTDQNLKMS